MKKKTKEQLVEEIRALQRQITELEKPESEPKRAEKELFQKAKDELEKRNARLETLYRVGQMVNSTLEPDAILDRLTDEAMRVTRATHGQVLVVQEETGGFERRSLRGFSPEETELARTVPLPLDQGINGRAYTTRQAVRVDDVQTEPGYFPLIPTTCTELAVPIIRDGHVLGNLDLQSPEVGAFRDVDLDYLNILANQVAIALANAQIFHAVEQARRDWEVTFNAMQDAIALIDQDYRIVQTNQAFMDIAPGTLRQVVGQRYDIVLDGASCPEAACPLEQTLESGRPATCVHEYGGRVFEVQTIPVWEEDVEEPGYVARMVYVMRDITERKRAEETLHDSIQRTEIAYQQATVYARELKGEIAERKRTEETLKRRAEQLAALSRASQAVTASLELDQVLAEIVSLAGEVSASDYTSVVLVDEAGHLGESAENVSGSPAIEYRVRDEGLTTWIVRLRQAVVIEIGEDGAINPDLGAGAPRTANPFIVEAGVKSVAGLPLLVKDRLLGVLYLHSLRPAAFHDQLPLLTTFANQVAIAIENARLYDAAQQELAQRKRAEKALRHSLEETARSQRTLLALSQAAQAVQRARTPDEVYRTVGDGVTRLGYHAIVFSLTADRTHLAISYQPFESALLQSAEKLTGLSALGLRFAVKPGDIHDQILTKGQTIFCESVVEPMAESLPMLERPRVEQVAAMLGLEQAIYAPLTAGGETHGLLVVAGTGLTEADAPAVTTFANQAAVALENARLYSQLESRERFITRILDSIPTSLVAIDRSLRIVSVNRNFLEKTRREAQATLGRKIEDIFPQVLLEYTRLDQKVREVFRTGELVEGGKMAYRAPGLPSRIYYYRLIPLKAEEAVDNVMLLMDDITEREQLAEEVRRAERHLASVVECANDLVISMDPQGHVVTWNRAAERTSGLKAEEVQKQPMLSLCVAEQRPVMAEMLQRLAHGKGSKNAEVNLLTANGQEVPIAWSCAPMRDDAGKVAGIVAVGRDLTERRRMETQLIHSAKMASLGVMAGGIAHELRNPLGVISLSAQLLLERPDDAQLRNQCAQKIHAATQRASLIIENLLKFARPQSERIREVDLHKILEETFTLLAHQMILQKIGLKKELQPNLSKVYGNPDLLQQVFTNLILNACNAMPQGGTLKVVTQSTDAGQVQIQFEDTGHGIPPENLPQIFDPFFTTMPVGKGTGLGLSISYSIVQQHQGTIDVESQVGKGSTFIVRLPVDSRQPIADG